MVQRTVVAGIRRRIFRASVQREIRRGTLSRREGHRSLGGYGVSMHYPDEEIWLHQISDIFCNDCYGVGRLSDDSTVVDVGANIGAFTLFVKWMWPNSNIIAVEPECTNLKYLRENLAHCTNLTIFEKAVSTSEGTTKLNGKRSDAMRTGADNGVSVGTVPLSSLLTGVVQLLKIDAEGAELDILRSAGKGLRLVERVVIEYHRYRNNPTMISSLIEVLETQGFNRFRITDEKEFQPKRADGLCYCCLLTGEHRKL
ncbi:MAG: FkbM family methyltransferase [Lentisphaerae bacterium]|nr:FkbM family methyltransferase [Lentisphaerota bacterium]